MSYLARFTTHLGPVELHHEAGRFTTRRTVEPIEATLFSKAESYVCTILIDRERAQEWYELAERQGCVYVAFPEREAVSA